MTCAPSKDWSAWASTQSDQSLCCPPEEGLGSVLPIKRTAKTLTRLGRCPGGSESLFGAQVILLVLSCCGSTYKMIYARIEAYDQPRHPYSPISLCDYIVKDVQAIQTFKVFTIHISVCRYLSCSLTKPTKCTVCTAKTQISLGIRPVWLEPLVCTLLVANDPMLIHVDSELGRCPGWSESSLDVQVILLIGSVTCCSYPRNQNRQFYCNFRTLPGNLPI